MDKYKITKINDDGVYYTDAEGTEYYTTMQMIKKAIDLFNSGMQDYVNTLPDNSIDGSKLKDATITTDKIADRAVTRDKIAASAVGDVEIANGAVNGYKIGLAQVGNKHLAENSVTANKIADISIFERHIGDNAITSSKIANNAVTSIKLLDRAVGTTKLDNKSVTADKLADNSVTSNKLTEGSVDWHKISPNKLPSDVLEDNCITTEKIADGAVNADKLNSSIAYLPKIVKEDTTNGTYIYDLNKGVEFSSDDINSAIFMTYGLNGEETDIRIKTDLNDDFAIFGYDPFNLDGMLNSNGTFYFSISDGDYRTGTISYNNPIFALNLIDGFFFSYGAGKLRIDDRNVLRGCSLFEPSSKFALNIGVDGLTWYDTDIDMPIFEVLGENDNLSFKYAFTTNTDGTSLIEIKNIYSSYYGISFNKDYTNGIYMGAGDDDQGELNIYAPSSKVVITGGNGIVMKQNIYQPETEYSGAVYSDESGSTEVGTYSIRYIPLYNETGTLIGGQGSISIVLNQSIDSGISIYLDCANPYRFAGGLVNVSEAKFALIAGYPGDKYRVDYTQLTPTAGTWEGFISLYNN